MREGLKKCRQTNAVCLNEFKTLRILFFIRIDLLIICLSVMSEYGDLIEGLMGEGNEADLPIPGARRYKKGRE